MGDAFSVPFILSFFRSAKQQLCTCITLFCTFLCSQVSFSYPFAVVVAKLPNIACYLGHATRSAVGTLYMYNNKKKLWGSQNCFRKEFNLKKSYVYIASVLNRLPPRKQFLAGNCFISCFHDPDSVSEVSAECEFPAHLSFWKALLEKFHCNDIKAAFTLKTTFFLWTIWICKLLCFKSALKFRKQLRLWFDIVCCNNHWNIDDTINLLSSFLNV